MVHGDVEGDEIEDYESGPFCRHWGDPADCDEPCARCGHRCSDHPYDGCCDEDDCSCPDFVEPPEPAQPEPKSET